MTLGEHFIDHLPADVICCSCGLLVFFQEFLNKIPITCNFSKLWIENHDWITWLRISLTFVFAKNIFIKMLTYSLKLISFRINLLSIIIEDFFRVVYSAFAENKDINRILSFCKLPSERRKIDKSYFEWIIFFNKFRYNCNLFPITVKSLPWKGDYIDSIRILANTNACLVECINLLHDFVSLIDFVEWTIIFHSNYSVKVQLILKEIS